MRTGRTSECGFTRAGALFVVSFVAAVAVVVFFAGPVRRFVREYLMARITSAHYEILFPAGSASPEIMRQFASDRETLFTTLNRKLGDAASNSEIQIIFNARSGAPAATANGPQHYVVTGMTVRTDLNGNFPRLDSAADAEALLHAVWGKPGNPEIARWTSIWLVGEWHGEELGMAAAGVEQKHGHQKVASLLGQAPSGVSSPDDRTLLGAAWINEIAELGGQAEVRDLYSTPMAKPDFAAVTKALGTSSPELERKWQMWIYGYIAGMPSAPHTMTMPMNMPMSK